MTASASHFEFTRLGTVVMLALSLLGATVGCGGGGASPTSVESARALTREGKEKEAIIRLKATLQADPSAADARLALGEALLRSGEPQLAAVELRKAIELGRRDAAIPLLVRALLDNPARAARAHKDLLSEYGSMRLDDPKEQAALTALLGIAHGRDGNRKAANEATETAYAAAPESETVAFARAKILAAQRQFDAALAILDDGLKRHPKSMDLLVLRADTLLLGIRDAERAQEALANIIALRPDHLSSHVALFGIHANKGDRKAMRAQLEAAAKVRADDPQVVFLAAQLAAVEGDFSQAKVLMDKVQKFVVEAPVVLEFAGWVELKLKSLPQAEAHLAKAVSLAPAAPSPRRWLATVHIASHEPQKAVDVLRPNVERESPDFLSLGMMGEAQLHLGNPASAEKYFQLAVKAKPGDPRARTSMAMMRIAQGDAEGGLRSLENVASASAESVADLALIATLLRRNETARALGAIDQFEKKEPASALADLLRGRVLARERRTDDARKSFEKALDKDARFLPAVAALASLDVAQGRFQDAERRYLDLLKASPKHTAMHLALADLRRQAGAPRTAVLQALEAAVKSSPAEPGPRLALIGYYTSIGERGLALETAQTASSSMPNNAELLLALGELQGRSREHRQAVLSVSKAVALRPKSDVPLLMLADVQRLAGDFDGAIRSLLRALEVAPHSGRAREALFNLYRQQRKTSQALQLATDLQRTSPKDPMGYQWEAEVLLSQKNQEQAVKTYRRGLAATTGGTLPERLFTLLESTKRKDEAERFAADWQQRHPKDIGLPMYRGNSAFVRADYSTAEKYYGEAARIEPTNVLALNNLAWAMAKLRKPGSVAVAERASAGAPDSATVQDTLAFALASEGHFDRAIATSKALYARYPTVHKYRLTLARAYLMSGDKSRAAAELDELQKLGTQFPAQTEVAELLASLK